MTAAVVILNWNGEALLRQFLPSVLKYTDPLVGSVYVADNASTDGSLRLLEESFPQVRVVPLAENYGFAEGYNRALAQIEADYFVLLNSDVEVADIWLTPLLAFLSAHPDVSAVQPKILKYSNPSPAETAPYSFEYAGAAGGFLDKYGYPFCRGRLFSTIEEDEGQYDEPMEVQWASGACLVVRADDYRLAGGLDGRFFAHHEEIDLCWRLRVMGKKIYCLPESKVFHVGGASLPQGSPRKTYLNYRNNLTLIYKNMPRQRVGKVLRMRCLLDNIAALKELLTGHLSEAQSIRKARKDFNNWKEQFKHERDMLQQSRQLSPKSDTTPLCLLWQYFVRNRKKWSALPIKLLLCLLVFALSAHADDKTRGIGVYPGRPSEAFAPIVVEGGDVYRNLSLHHKVYHSSSYDYNLTGQLLTDGLLAQGEPPRVEVLVNGVNLPKNEREYGFDGNDWNRNVLMGSKVSYRINWYGMKVDVDSIVLNCTLAYHKELARNGYEITVSDGATVLAVDKGSSLPGKEMKDGLHSDPNKQTERGTLPARVLSKGFAFSTDSLSTFLLNMEMEGVEYWAISDIKFFKEGRAVDTELLPMSKFQSVWMSESGGEQWAYVDLGARATIEEIRLFWMRHIPHGRLEVSDDAEQWEEIVPLPEDEPYYRLPVSAEGRYVRVVVDGYDKPYMLSELEVLGRGGTTILTPEAPQVEGRILSLNGGDWHVRRSTAETYPPELIATPGFPTAAWLPATVPATVLTSFVNAQAVPDPNFDDNVQYASESYFYSNFYYRREFTLPETFAHKQVFLNLDGINWKAQLWLNGKKIGRVEGAFMRGRIDITSLLKERNVLVVEIERPAHPGATKEKTYMFPGANGGLLGRDNPTFHASVGWDWIPTVRGREIGIWNDVYLSAEEGLSLSDPLISTTLNLPDTLATFTPTIQYTNSSGRQIAGSLHGWIGSLTFDKDVTLNVGKGTIKFSPEDYPSLRDARMRLWWPNGYGAPYLYDAGFCFISEQGDTLSAVQFRHGVRQVTYEDIDKALKIYVNGRRVVPLGGNWGFSEQNLNFRKREYDIAVRNHRDMHFNMIRNWVGQTGDEEFYEACDKYGIMVWQDFWLANPADGPDPEDERLFESNAIDFVYKIRNHPSIVLYCGRNEGYPPESLDRALRAITAMEHPHIAYISSSADDGVSGHGPYNALPAKEYFERQTGLLHSERGMPNIMTIEGLQRTMRPSHLWPQGDVWGQHDYTMTGAQRGASFNELIAERFGQAADAESFARWAQMINYEGYRAMFESGSKDRMGLLIWMSHACWPSLSWQCYDYYFEPTAAYFGCKQACEPLHIQYNASTTKVEVVNIGVGDYKNLKATIETFSLAGQPLTKTKTKVSSKSDSTTELLPVANAADEILLRLTLYDKKKLISTNTYVLAEDMKDLEPTRVSLFVGQTVELPDGERSASVSLNNEGDHTAYLLRIMLCDGEGQQLLPVNYSDNYFHLLPGETKTISVRWAAEDQYSDDISIALTGLNINL